MKYKKTLIGAGFVGLGLLAGAGYALKQKRDDFKRQQLTQNIRDYFIQMGPIQVLYINSYESDETTTTGGVVLENGRSFEFVYRDGTIDYMEDKR